MIQQQTQKTATDVTGYYARQSAGSTVHDAGRNKRPAPGQHRRLPETHLLLAECPTPHEIQRDLERSESGAIGSKRVSSPIRNKQLRGDNGRHRSIRSGRTGSKFRAAPACPSAEWQKLLANMSFSKTFPWKSPKANSSPFSAKADQEKRPCCGLLPDFEHAPPVEFAWRGERIDSLPPYRRPVNTVFQNYALFPHLTSKKTSDTVCGLPSSQPKKWLLAWRSAGHGQDGRLRKIEAFEDQRRTAATDRTGPRSGEPSVDCCCWTNRFRSRCEPATPDASRTKVHAA